MDIPGIGRKKIDETPPSEPTREQQASKDQTSSGVAAAEDSLQSAADEGPTSFETGWASTGSTKTERHSGLGGNEETQSLVVGG